jgi:uncharacterized membrane protein
MSLRQTPGQHRRLPLPARAAVALESNAGLEPVRMTMSRVTAPLRTSGAGSVLRGEWLGHALHPALTDLPLGVWTAASVLDLFAGVESRPAARRLVGIGLLSAAPTAVTGWAEWSRTSPSAQRVGLVHAGLNVAALGLYAGSWAARRSARHRAGAALALLGAATTTAAGYLGGHLTTVRNVSSAHPAFSATDPDRQDRRSDNLGGQSAALPPLTGEHLASDTVTPDDVRAAIANQHSRITELVHAVSLGSEHEQGAALTELLRYVAGHEAVEEELIHPLVPAVGERDLGAARAREETGMAEQIELLERLEVGSRTFLNQFGLLEDAISRHAKAEEQEELPEVLKVLDDDDARLIVRALAAQEEAVSRRNGTFAQMLASAKVQVRSMAQA